MRIVVCLLLSIAIGFAVYIAGAVIWAIVDPLGAGASLLFTIPIAVVGMAVPALVGSIAMINHGRWDTAKPAARRVARVRHRPKAVNPLPPRLAADALQFQLAA